jgi:hypothetical protein
LSSAYPDPSFRTADAGIDPALSRAYHDPRVARLRAIRQARQAEWDAKSPAEQDAEARAYVEASRRKTVARLNAESDPFMRTWLRGSVRQADRILAEIDARERARARRPMARLRRARGLRRRRRAVASTSNGASRDEPGEAEPDGEGERLAVDPGGFRAPNWRVRGLCALWREHEARR